MPRVERAHGWNQSDRPAVAAKRGHGSPKRINVTDYLHGFTASDTR
jgi:hypothetical protein